MRSRRRRLYRPLFRVLRHDLAVPRQTRPVLRQWLSSLPLAARRTARRTTTRSARLSLSRPGRLDAALTNDRDGTTSGRHKADPYERSTNATRSHINVGTRPTPTNGRQTRHDRTETWAQGRPRRTVDKRYTIAHKGRYKAGPDERSTNAIQSQIWAGTRPAPTSGVCA